MGFRYPEGQNGWGKLRYRNGVPVLEVAGTPEQMGEAVGALALTHAPQMAAYPRELMRKFCARWLTPVITRLGECMVHRLDPAYRSELEAIARGAGLDRSVLVLGNTLFDIKKIVACSALMVEGARSATGTPLMGRNLDYPSEGYAHQYSLVTVYRPAGKQALVSVGFPGLVGTLSGMNEAGLVLAILEVFQAPLYVRRLDPFGTPYAVCFRKILEECQTIEQAREALTRMRRTTLYNVAVADRRRVAVFEVTPGRVRERGACDGVCICTNHFHSNNLQTAFPINWMRTFDRDRMLRWAKKQCDRMDVAYLHRSMHLAQQGDHTLQTMVFDPASLRLHLAVGQLPSSAGPLMTLELADLLRGQVREAA